MHAIACEDTYAKYSRWDTVTRVRSTLGPGTWTREACVLAQRAASIAAESRCASLSSGLIMEHGEAVESLNMRHAALTASYT